VRTSRARSGRRFRHLSFSHPLEEAGVAREASCGRAAQDVVVAANDVMEVVPPKATLPSKPPLNVRALTELTTSGSYSPGTKFDPSKSWLFRKDWRRCADRPVSFVNPASLWNYFGL
jgi:hypothetical protein